MEDALMRLAGNTFVNAALSHETTAYALHEIELDEPDLVAACDWETLDRSMYDIVAEDASSSGSLGFLSVTTQAKGDCKTWDLMASSTVCYFGGFENEYASESAPLLAKILDKLMSDRFGDEVSLLHNLKVPGVLLTTIEVSRFASAEKPWKLPEAQGQVVASLIAAHELANALFDVAEDLVDICAKRD